MFKARHVPQLPTPPRQPRPKNQSVRLAEPLIRSLVQQSRVSPSRQLRHPKLALRWNRPRQCNRRVVSQLLRRRDLRIVPGHPHKLARRSDQSAPPRPHRQLHPRRAHLIVRPNMPHKNDRLRLERFDFHRRRRAVIRRPPPGRPAKLRGRYSEHGVKSPRERFVRFVAGLERNVRDRLLLPFPPLSPRPPPPPVPPPPPPAPAAAAAHTRARLRPSARETRDENGRPKSMPPA